MSDDTRYRELLMAATEGRLNRREVLKRAALLGISAPAIATLLAACGGDDSDSGDSGNGGSTSDATATSSTDGDSTPDSTSDDSPSEGGERGGGGELRLLYWQAPTILNAHLSQGTKDFHASRICLEPLAEFDTNGNIILILAAEAPTLENGMIAEDGTSVTWKLKEGVTWHDGEPFTSKDVKFTYEYLINTDTAAVTYGNYETIESIETPDDYTVIINFKQPEPAWHKPFTGENGMVLPEHILRDYVGTNARNAEFNLKPIGTGPYKVVDFRPGDVVLYEINENYHEPGKPYFDRIELKGGGDAASAARAVLQTGEADWAWNLQVEAEVLDALEKSGDGKLVVWPGGGTEKLLINRADPHTEHEGQRAHKDIPHPHFQELKVRQALALSIQRDVIADTLYGAGGEATASTVNILPTIIPEDISWEFDLDKAAALLDEVGAEPGPNGIRVLNDREMKWVYQTSINPVRQKTQEIIKDALSKLGIDVELKAIEASVYFSGDPGNEDTTGHFYADLEMYTNNPTNMFPLDWYRRYLSTAIAQKENQWSADNYSRYQNPEFDELYHQVEVELDPDKQIELFKEMQRVVWRDVAEIGIVARNNVAAAAGDLTGYDPSPWRPELADIANWKRS